MTSLTNKSKNTTNIEISNSSSCEFNEWNMKVSSPPNLRKPEGKRDLEISGVARKSISASTIQPLFHPSLFTEPQSAAICGPDAKPESSLCEEQSKQSLSGLEIIKSISRKHNRSEIALSCSSDKEPPEIADFVASKRFLPSQSKEMFRSPLFPASRLRATEEQTFNMRSFSQSSSADGLDLDSSKQFSGGFKLPTNRSSEFLASNLESSSSPGQNIAPEGSKGFVMPQPKPIASSLPNPDFQLFCPDEQCFNEGRLHQERAAALGLKVPKKVPPTPTRKAKPSSLPAPLFINNALKTYEILENTILDAKQGGVMNPFYLTVAPGLEKLITQIEKLPSTGQNSQVYKCSVQGEGQWILKILNIEILKERGRAISAVTSQLFTYWKNCRNPFLSKHIARHVNFDCHLTSLDTINNSSGLTGKKIYAEMKNYVENTLQQGFIFAEYVPTEFPTEFNKNDPAFIQIKEIFRECSFADVENDIRYNNVRLDEKGTVKIIDLYELHSEEKTTDPKEQARTFASEPEEHDWLIE